MTTPLVLELRPDALVRPIRPDLAIVEGMMLWPEDAAVRRRLHDAALVDYGRAQISDMPKWFLRRYAEEAAIAAPIADFQGEAAQRFTHGSFVGIILGNAITYASTAPEKAALRKVQQEFCQAMKGTFQIEPRTLNNRNGPYHKFKPVAHLWAAHLMARHGGNKIFPCRVDDLALFLATAEAIREVAECTRAKKARAPVMRPGEAARLPDDVAAALHSARGAIAR